MAALDRVGGVGDEVYRDALAKLVGAAFHDDAKIEELALMTAQLLRLEPLHLRVLGVGLWPAYLVDIICRRPRTAPVDLDVLPHLLDISAAAAGGACDALVAAGFLAPPEVDVGDALLDYDKERRKQESRALNDFFGETTLVRHLERRYPITSEYRVTPWGASALALVHPFELRDDAPGQDWWNWLAAREAEERDGRATSWVDDLTPAG